MSVLHYCFDFAMPPQISSYYEAGHSLEFEPHFKHSLIIKSILGDLGLDWVGDLAVFCSFGERIAKKAHVVHNVISTFSIDSSL